MKPQGIKLLLTPAMILLLASDAFCQIAPMDIGGGTAPPNPNSTLTVSSNTCGNKTVTRSGTPPAGVMWYWQVSPTGTDKSNSTTTYVVSVEGTSTIYLRAYKPSNDKWSTGTVSTNVTVNPDPATPAAPSVTNQCGQSVLTRGTPPSSPAGTTWYWQGTNSNGTSTSNSATTYTATTSGTYYLRARSSAGCWSAPVGVSVSVASKPGTPPTPSTSGNTCGPVTLTFNGTPPANVRWYWQTSPSGTSTSLGYDSPKTITTSGNYYLRAYHTISGCWSDLSSGAVSVTYNPAVSAPSASGVTREEPGKVELEASIGTNGTGIRWYDAASGGNLLAEEETYSPVVAGTTTFYVSSFNSSTGCESSRVAVTATVTPKPVISYTSLYIVSGNPVTLSVANNTYSTYSWQRDGTQVGTASSINVTQAGTYTVVVTKTGMTGSGTAASVTISVGEINSVAITSVRKQGVTSVSSLSSLTASDVSKATSFSGGLGNVLQTITSRVSPSQKDVVAPVEYDLMGRVLKGYLPYESQADNSVFRGNALSNGGYTGSEQYQFYQTAADVVHDTKPYSVTEVEPSPLGRVVAQMGAGSAWHTNQKKVTFQYLLGRSADAVRIWTVSGNLPVSSAAYGDYQLYLNQVTDENGNLVKTWTDKQGRTVMKAVQHEAQGWLRTTYIYDDKGRLGFVLTPEGTKAGNYSPNQDFLDQWAFQYRYDSRNRLVEYKAPGAGWIYTVYDKLNRPVLTQNGDQRSRSEWSFVKYDVHGRAVAVGYKAIPSSTRSSVQAAVDAQTHQYELTTSNSVGYTLNRTYPTNVVEGDLLSISYYDNYSFLTNSGWDAEAHNFAFVPELGSTANSPDVKGLPTGAKVKILSTTTWLNAVQYYDKYYRPIQVIAENHIGALDRSTNKYNSLRYLEETRLSHNNGAVIVLRKLTYDPAGRITQVRQNVNNAPTDQLVAQYEYNALGQLIDRKLHNTSGTDFLQSVDYQYNIRGWIASINNAQLDGNGPNDDTGDLFGMEFLYTQTESALGNGAYYNGNLSAIKWKGPGDGVGASNQRSYKYSYDKSDRLLTATAQMYNGSTWTKETGVINEAITYDHNGNIKTLQRNHRKHTLSGLTANYVQETVDNLTYTYGSTQGNQVAKVEDAVGVAIGTGDFKNNANLTTEYTYNADGNLTADKNKGIDSVHYNVLGKVRRIKFSDGRVITYLYDAGGNKLRMKNYDASQSLEKMTDYVGSFVYTDGALDFFGSPEGRVVKKGSTFEYEYGIVDHQGNTRVVFTSATPQPETVTADMESATNSNFENYTNRVAFNLFDHTDAGTAYTYAQKLTGGYNSQVGVAKSYKVYPGDKVKIEAWGKYQNPTGTQGNLTAFASALLSAFGISPPGMGEAGTASAALDAWGSIVAAGDGGTSSGPNAFVNIIAFDKDFNLLDAAWEAIDPGAEQVGASPVVTHDYMMVEYTVKHEGYVFMYVSNENPTLVDVYFDDVVITYTPTNVLQYNEYYPFGLQTSNSWTRENSSNDFLYNGGSELNGTTAWYETFFRGYDPVLGRFNQVDPMAHAASSFTPYNYAFNDPVVFNDPNGDYPPGTIEKMWGGGHGLYGNGWGGAIGVGSRSYVNDWGADFRSIDMNAILMSRREFNMFYGTADSYGRVNEQRRNDVAWGAAQAPTQNDLDAINSAFGTHFELNSNGGVGYWDMPLYEWGAQAIWVPVGAQQEGPGRFFTNEGDAYRYMWNSSFDADGKVQQEVAAFLTSKGVLVLPTEGKRTNGEYAKNGPRRSYNDFLPLSRKDGNIFVTFNGAKYQVLGQVHTHPNTQPFGSYEVASDLVTQNFLGVPVYMIRTDGFYNTSGTVLGTQLQFFNGTKSLIGGK